MVKTPKTRHSKNRRDPVTIELEPGEVSRIDEQAAPAQASTEELAAEDPRPEAAGDSPDQEAMRAGEADFEPWEHDEAARAAAEHEQAQVQAETADDEAASARASQHASEYILS